LGAAAKFVLPAWLAAMEQVPAASRVTILPETVQTAVEVELKLTGSVDVAVAASVTVPEPNATLLSVPKVMVCEAGVTLKLWTTLGAAVKFELPGWLAVMEHVPAAVVLTTDPATVQTPVVVEVNVTGRFDVAVAVRLNDGALKETLLIGPNVMVWAA
jgi:hypothetical protein